MYNMREIKEEDFEAVAKFEIEISEISFGEKAITDLEFHCKKLAKAKDRRGMIVIEDTESGKIVGWALSLSVGFLIFLLQLKFCKWWLARHKQGPLEYIWHKCTWIGTGK